MLNLEFLSTYKSEMIEYLEYRRWLCLVVIALCELWLNSYRLIMRNPTLVELFAKSMSLLVCAS